MKTKLRPRNNKRINKKRTALYAVVTVIAVLALVRMALPFIVKSYINRTLEDIKGYSGYVEDVDIALWRGAYELHGIKIEKDNAGSKRPFFSANEVDVSLDWRALFNGKAVSKIKMFEPKIEISIEKSKAQSQASVDVESWQKQLQKLYPLQINRFAIYDGFIRFQNKTSSPKINIYAGDLNLHADNISNSTKSSERLPSSVKLTGLVLHSGKIKANAKFNLMTEPTEVDLNAAMLGLDLREVNDFAKAYGNFDFEKGKFNLTAELAASKTKYTGYIKTAMVGADILDWDKEKKKGDSTGHLIWEGLAGSIADIFENQKRDQFAARIPISGSRSELKFNNWAAVGSVLRNAFIKALSPDLEDSVQFSDAVRSGTSRESK